MTIIKGTTKKGKNMIYNAGYYDGYDLYDVYNTCSHAKRKAYEWCKEQCYKENGSNFHITSHNTFGFSVAWEVENGVRIETPQNSYLVLYEEYCN